MPIEVKPITQPLIAAAQAAQAPSTSTAQASTYQAQTGNAVTFDAEKGDTHQANAVTREVAPNELVQKQIEGIVSNNSILLQQARQRAYEEANARGLRNSTMALRSGEAAVFDAAMPIATADAAAYGQAARDNQSVRNQVELANSAARQQGSQFNAGLITQVRGANASAQNDMTRTNLGAVNDASRTNANAQTQVSMANADSTNRTNLAAFDAQTQANFRNSDASLRVALQQMDSATRQDMARIEAEYQTQMQSSSSAAQMYSESIRSIGQIQQNPDLDAGAKLAASRNMVVALRGGLAVASATNDLRLDELLTFDFNAEDDAVTKPIPNTIGPVQNAPGPAAGPMPTPPAYVEGA